MSFELQKKKLSELSLIELQDKYMTLLYGPTRDAKNQKRPRMNKISLVHNIALVMGVPVSKKTLELDDGPDYDAIANEIKLLCSINYNKITETQVARIVVLLDRLRNIVSKSDRVSYLELLNGLVTIRGISVLDTGSNLRIAVNRLAKAGMPTATPQLDLLRDTFGPIVYLPTFVDNTTLSKMLLLEYAQCDRYRDQLNNRELTTELYVELHTLYEDYVLHTQLYDFVVSFTMQLCKCGIHDHYTSSNVYNALLLTHPKLSTLDVSKLREFFGSKVTDTTLLGPYATSTSSPTVWIVYNKRNLMPIIGTYATKSAADLKCLESKHSIVYQVTVCST
jgi:hypothetical protein